MKDRVQVTGYRLQQRKQQQNQNLNTEATEERPEEGKAKKIVIALRRFRSFVRI